jgi:multiple sugar transport system permease protein
VAIPLSLAILVSDAIPGRALFRSAFTTPLMISVSSVGVLWVWFLNPTFGLINYYFGLVGLPGQNWLTQNIWAMVAVVITTVWWTSGWNLVLFLAGLQEISESLYEAAKLDGANSWALFRYITIPGLRPTLLFVGVTTIIGSFRVFGQVLVMTGGGPFDSTRTLVQHIYETGFRNFRMGSASAIAWALFLIVMIFILLQFRLLRETES